MTNPLELCGLQNSVRPGLHASKWGLKFGFHFLFFIFSFFLMLLFLYFDIQAQQEEHGKDYMIICHIMIHSLLGHSVCICTSRVMVCLSKPLIWWALPSTDCHTNYSKSYGFGHPAFSLLFTLNDDGCCIPFLNILFQGRMLRELSRPQTEAEPTRALIRSRSVAGQKISPARAVSHRFLRWGFKIHDLSITLKQIHMRKHVANTSWCPMTTNDIQVSCQSEKHT